MDFQNNPQKYYPQSSNKIFKKFVKIKYADHKSLLKDELNLLKNEIISLTRESKTEYYKTYFSKNKENLFKIWKGIKEL